MNSSEHPPRSSDLPTRLSLEAAVASCMIRAGTIPAPLFSWLAGPNGAQPCQGDQIDRQCDDRLTAALNEIIQPVQNDASQTEQRNTRYAAQWLAATCHCAAKHYGLLQLGIGPRLLAASLLPLYRCLATGNLSEGLQQSRARLAELLSLLALCHELGDELIEVLDGSNRRMDSPDSILSAQFTLSLSRVAELMGELASGFDVDSRQFTPASAERLRQLEPKQSPIPAWAAPGLLWKLSGELISENSELVLPRSWIETPVPWKNVADHWQKLSRQLSNESSTQPSTTVISLGNVPVENVGDEENTLATIEEISAIVASNETKNVEPKVLIAEIHSHNDPIFVNVIRRQIGKCRAEDRAVSLVSMIVLPEDENEQHEVHENGLKRWQQKLVNWLAEHPQVVEPYAFLTTDGELLLCLLDLERNETTSLVRQGLVEVLTGGRVDVSRGNVLAKVNVPARYHAGIASTSSPGARFSPEQLIQPAISCLSAASIHGKASIKSIEVY